MRILYCNKYNFPFSGTEIHLFELMDLMRARGHEVALFSMADRPGRATPYDQHFVPHVNFKQRKQGLLSQAKLAGHAIYSREARRRLRGMISEFRPDVAHIRNIYHHLSPSILWELKRQDVPVIYHLNDFKLLCPSYNMVAHGRACEKCQGGKFWHVSAEGCYAGGRSSALVLAAEAYIHKWFRTYESCVTRFLAPSRFVKDKLVANGWDAKKIDVLPHFQRLPEKTLPPKADAAILYFGRLSAEKGVADLLWAMEDTRDVNLIVAGDGPERSALQALAQELKLTNVRFVGHQNGSDLDDLISASRFTVLPSRAYETLGKSILESYAWERGVIATDLGSRRELVHEGETGILFQPGDIQQLASAIRFLADRPDLAGAMGIKGRTLVQEKHSPESYCLALDGIYETVAARAGKPVHPAVSVAAHPPFSVAFIGGRGVISKYSGIETYYEEVGRRLGASGGDVTVYCRNYFTPDIAGHTGMRLVRLPTIRSKHLETLIHTFLSTLHVCFSRRCDIVHYHCLGPALFSFLPRIFGKKTVVTVQGLDWKRKKWGRIASAALRCGEKASARFPDATVVVSRELQQHYQLTQGVETAHIPNGAIPRTRTAGTQLQKWCLEPGKYILFLGRFSPEKNCHLLIEAFKKIETDVKLVLAGGPSYSNDYITALHRHESDKIRLLDWVAGDALDDLLTNTMLFVLPSDLEGLSLALLDAMGAGVCTLASDIPENREVIGDAGFTFRAGNVHDLKRMLQLLIASPQMREITGLRARERVRELYRWDKVAGEVLEIYLELMCASPGTAKASSQRYLVAPRSDTDVAA